MAGNEDNLSNEQLLEQIRAEGVDNVRRLSDILVLSTEIVTRNIEELRRDLREVKDSVKEVGAAREPHMIVHGSSIYRRVGEVPDQLAAQQSAQQSTQQSGGDNTTNTPEHASVNGEQPSAGQNQDPEPPEDVDNAGPVLNPIAGVPQFRLSRDITTVTEVWREWTEGLEGKPPIQDLEDQYKAAWRKYPGEKVFFCRRKLIVDEVKSLIAGGMPENAAVNRMEAKRLDHNLSLRKLHDFIKAKKMLS